MTLLGFQASNHPQQTAKRGAVDSVDDRETSPEFIDTLEARFGTFTLDVAAAAHNAKAERFYTLADDGLTQQWSGHVWCNPPYSDLGAWVGKAWAEWHRKPLAYRGEKVTVTEVPDTPYRIVMLVPANRVEQAWWQDHIEPYRDQPGSPLRVEFQRGRMRFKRPDWTPGPKGDRPPFGLALLIWGANGR